MEFDGIVIKNSHYKDNDAMITIVTDKGLVSFLAKGIFKISSKNARACQLYTYGNYEFVDGKYGNLLKTATSIFNVINVYNSFESLTCLSLIGEATFCAVNEYDTYNVKDLLLDSIKRIEEGINPYFIVTEYLIILLKKSGYGIDVDEIKLNKTLVDVYNTEILKDDLEYNINDLKKLLEEIIIYFEDSFGVKLRSHETILL